MKGDTLSLSLVASFVIHGVLILLASIVIRNAGNLRRENYLPVDLVEVPRRTEVKPVQNPEPPPPPPPPKIEKAKPSILAPKTEPIQTKPVPATVAREEPAKPVEEKMPAKPEAPATNAPTAKVAGGGSEAGAGNLFDKGDVGVVPEAGTASGSGGSASSGLGRGAGEPGLPAVTTPLRTNREAMPIQTVRASYPPMALRMGMESDVTLRIEVDTEGKVITAEITKSGGAGFDEEALKAIRQSRFEPAQKDGRNVPAEFTYIYRFRLRK
ncbi:MAG: TonB family protein [Candidatus Binatia bacterium]